jgi:hypothetical protein
MKNESLPVITWSLFFVLSLSAAHGAEKAVISYSSRTYAFLPAQIAVVKVFSKMKPRASVDSDEKSGHGAGVDKW